MNKLLDVAEQRKEEGEYKKVGSICILQRGSGPHLRSWEPVKDFNQSSNMNRSQIVFRKFLKCLSNASIKEKIHYRHNHLRLCSFLIMINSISILSCSSRIQSLNSLLLFFKQTFFFRTVLDLEKNGESNTEFPYTHNHFLLLLTYYISMIYLLQLMNQC